MLTKCQLNDLTKCYADDDKVDADATRGNSRDFYEVIMCKFCTAMANNRDVERFVRGRATEYELSMYGKYMMEYSVAIVKRSWYQKKGKKAASRTTEYRYRGSGFALNYCPECGRRM